MSTTTTLPSGPTSLARGLGRRWRALALRIVAVHGLLVLLIALIITFSLLRPETFPTSFNFRSILMDSSVTALAALAVMIPLATKQFDLSVGYLLGLSHILAVGLQTKSGLSWAEAIIVVLLVGALVGLLNGLLITRARVDSFVATLGTGTILLGIANWYTGGEQLVGSSSPHFAGLATAVGGIPKPALYVLAVAIVLWIIFEYLPLGRRLYVLGANPRSAELTGISATRHITLAFMASGVLAALAGVVLGARLGVGNPSVGPEFLLPAFAAALLGATSVRPGRVNVWGTMLAVLILAVAFSGLQQLGAAFYVESLFNGSVLIVAVGLAVYATRRRTMRTKPGA
jgi:ribose transport system permease protein